MTGPDGSHGRGSPSHGHQPSPPADPGLFDFFFRGPSAGPEMSAADDIFLRGKLLPFVAPPALPTKRSKTHIPNDRLRDHRRADSVEGLDRPRGCCTGRVTPAYRKVRRVSESDSKAPPPIPPPKSRPRWYLFVFGSVRLPEAMEMRDIRSRQRRGSPTPIAAKAVADSSRWGGEAWRVPWKLLKSLSCKGMESAFAAAPLSYV